MTDLKQGSIARAAVSSSAKSHDHLTADGSYCIPLNEWSLTGSCKIWKPNLSIQFYSSKHRHVFIVQQMWGKQMDCVSCLLIVRAGVGVQGITWVTSLPCGGHNQLALLLQLFSNSFTQNHGRILITRYCLIFLKDNIINFYGDCTS